jgi:60 kDa SS-A/Ro ribonucleoprotein
VAKEGKVTKTKTILPSRRYVMQNVSTLLSSAAALKSALVGPKTHPNREGAPAYRRSLQEQVVCVLTTGTLGNTFYASGQQLAQEAIEVLLEAREECPDFLARALVYARRQGMMKTLPVLGLVVLSGGRGKTRALFESVFDRVICIPDDLRAFVALCRSGVIPGRDGLGGMAQKAVQTWLCNMSEYHAVKYGSANSSEITLRDILRLARPKPSTPAIQERFGFLVKGGSALGDDPSLNPQIRSLELLKKATTEAEQLTLIREGGLPYEVVIPSLKGTTPAIWEQLLVNAPYLNLLRNLVTFQRHDVFASEANIRLVVEKLTNLQAIARSKVLPFRFFDAWRACCANTSIDARITDALRAALETSFVNMPRFGNLQVAIGTDTSGSMGGQVSEKSSARFIDIAGIFTGALLKAIEGRAIPLPFDTHVHQNCGLSARDDVMVTADKISHFCGGGTAVGAPIQHLLERNLKVDVFIGITDEEDWAYGPGYFCNSSFLDLWRKYRQRINPDAQAFLVTIAPYRDSVAPTGEDGVHFIYGWSDHVLRYIPLKLQSGGSQLLEIEGIQLEARGEEVATADEDTDPDQANEE